MVFFRNNKKRRFQIYDPFSSLSNPELAGVIHSKSEFDYGTPNLNRSENITLIGSNSTSKETLVVKLKWRPLGGSSNLVTLISRLHFSTFDERCYESEEIETYEPQQVLVHSRESGTTKRIVQFGSRASKLRLYITSPYRRTRLVFMGQVRNKQDGSLAFLRLTCIMNPTAQLFDFLDQYDEQCVRQMYDAKKDPKPMRTFNDCVNSLLLHDRHDQKCRLRGEYSLFLEGGNERIKRPLFLWGFHCRHYISPSTQLKDIRSKRIYAYMINGQAYSLGNNKLDSDDIDFGYTSFANMPFTEQIRQPFEGISWHEQINENLEKFELQISGQQQTFTSKTLARRSFNIRPAKDKFLWFLLDTNESDGYAWVSLDDELVDSQEELELIEKSRNELELALEAGYLASSEVDAEGVDKRPLIVDLNAVECTLSELVGSKASSLAHLGRLQQRLDKGAAEAVQFKVPLGFATTKYAHDLLLKENVSLQDKIKQLETQVGGGELTNLSETCKELVQFVEKLKLPNLITEELAERLNSNFKDRNDLRFAVRSSSWGEDEEDMSAAGQLSTILDVANDIEKLSCAIMSCFASKFSPENVEYKRQHGLPLDLPMSVVVQEMISCNKAGVMFTCDPTNGDPSVFTITANYGLGESVVSAQADPDSIRVRVVPSAADDREPTVEIDEISVGKKNIIILPSSESGSSHIEQIDKSKCCLDEGETLMLAGCAFQVRKYFWAQQRDIEWGLRRENSNGIERNLLYLFQSRPVTGLETMTQEELLNECSKPSQAELGFYTRANIGEVMPYPISPLTLTCCIYSWTVLGSRLWINLSGLTDIYVPHCCADVYYEKYHSFFNLRCSMILSLGSVTRNILTKSMEIGLFGREMGAQPEILKAARGFPAPPNLWEGPKFDWEFKSLIWMPLKTVTKQRHVVERIREEVQGDKWIKSEPGDPKRLIELFRQLGYVMDCLEQAWINHIVNITLGTKQNVALTALLSKYIQDPMQLTAASNKFLAISPDVISAEIPERVEEMAKSIELRGRDELTKFVALSDQEALEYCRNSDNEALTEKFSQFIARFGHRCYNEFELAAKSWRQDPMKIVEMIRLNCSSKLASNVTKEEGSKRPKTIDEVIESLEALRVMTMRDRIALKYFRAPRSQLLLSIREQTKDIIVMQSDVVREASCRLAEELQRQLRLPDAPLIYYLTYDELQQVVYGHQPALVMSASRRRQMFKTTFDTLWKFDEIFSDIIPNHLKERQSAESEAALAQAPKLHGTPASSGRVQGKICLVNGYKELNRVRAGTILLTHSTDIAFSPVFPLISGIITEVGGLISHGAVVAREYGLPSVIGIPNVTSILQDEEEVILDADNGTIIRLSKQVAAEERQQ